MTSDEIRAVILTKRESREVELKGPMLWGNKQINAKIAQSLMALANLRAGGLLVIGVTEKPKGTFTLTGLSDEQFASYNQDDVSSFVNEYASPFVEFRLDRLDIEGMRFVTFDVNEFQEIPVVCRNSGPGEEKIGIEKEDKLGPLRRGALYNRSRRMNETVEVSSEAEMREILDLAVEKSLRRFFERAGSGGVLPTSESLSNEAFDRQLGDL
jgi:predicted HTH transcriptional regulator